MHSQFVHVTNDIDFSVVRKVISEYFQRNFTMSKADDLS